MQNLEALQFIVSVHDQLRLVAINPYEHHILEAVLHITPHQFVSCTIGEKLKGQYKHKDCNHSYFLVARYKTLQTTWNGIQNQFYFRHVMCIM